MRVTVPSAAASARKISTAGPRVSPRASLTARMNDVGGGPLLLWLKGERARVL